MRKKAIKTACISAAAIAVLVAIANFLGCSYDPVGRHPMVKAKTILGTRDDFTQEQKDKLTTHGALPIEVLRDFMKIQSTEVHYAIAGNPSVDLPMYEELIHDPVQQVRQAVATNPLAPHSILVQLLNDPNETVRWVLPGNPNWTPEEIRGMYQQTKVHMTSDVIFAMNPSTPSDILDSIADTGDHLAVGYAARNPGLSRLGMEKLAQHADASIRLEIARNAHTPNAILDSLATDPDLSVNTWASNMRRMRITQCAKEPGSAEACKWLESTAP